jgi:hypothetical protein
VDDESAVKNTVAYRIVRQIADHVYGPDEKVSSEEFLHVYRMFNGAGGSWEGLIGGDMKSVAILEGALERFIKWRNTFKVACRVAHAFDGQYRSP